MVGNGSMSPGASGFCSAIRARAAACPSEHIPGAENCAEIEPRLERLVRADVTSTVTDCVRRHACNPVTPIDQVCMRTAISSWTPSPHGNRVRAQCGRLSGSCGNDVGVLCMVLPYLQDRWLTRVEGCLSLQDCKMVEDCIKQLVESDGAN